MVSRSNFYSSSSPTKSIAGKKYSSTIHKNKLPQGHETILVVDDETMVLNITKTILSRLGYKLLSASSGIEAISIAKNHPKKIDLLLTDMMMPDISGCDVANELCKQDPDLVVVFSSGYDKDCIPDKECRGKKSHFISKPFRVNDLAYAIRRLLDDRTEKKTTT